MPALLQRIIEQPEEEIAKNLGSTPFYDQWLVSGLNSPPIDEIDVGIFSPDIAACAALYLDDPFCPASFIFFASLAPLAPLCFIPQGMQVNPRSSSRHRLCEEVAVRAHTVLGGLHHEYFWAPSTTSLGICG